MGIVDDLERARAAYERRDWATAYERLSAGSDLRAGDLLSLATAAYLLGDIDACIRALQRGYRSQVDAGDTLGAVRFAFWLGLVHNVRGEVAVGSGWSARAERLLADQPADLVERGYLRLHEFFRHLEQGDFAGASRLGTEITELARRFGDSDLLAQGLVCQGRLLMYSGRVPEGLALLDEAMVGVAAGEVSPIFAGNAYCAMIEACQEILDFARASAWTTALTRWCDSQPDLVPYTGQCAVHRGQILRLHGAYGQALAEFTDACRRYAESGAQAAAGLALSECGDVLRIRGDYAAAEASYAEAAGYGYEAQPGRALLQMARGRTSAAVAAVRRLLAETGDPVHRSRLLGGAVEVLLAGGYVDDAEAAAVELTEIATGFGCAGLRATAAYCSALVALERGDAEQALPHARVATQAWSGLQAPYEVARSKVLVGRAFRLLGDEDSAESELTAAAKTFGDLGAAPARQETEKLLHRDTAGGLTGRELEVLRLVASGNSNTEIAHRLVLSDKTVARHLTNIFTKLDVPSRTAAAAFARDHDLL
ncbi:helix-turn-helix transcriptional regulator [Kribbella turkmenica]|uniref:Helix-turn-helix transcriptional regulator n=1 Tax=Kribbella turkmenica TaxID=2530375 RepID=A0A4R4X099_9ACTN|nr:LuxR C-terminal-related transcriptional regulator [Kribbella turkmenica]TDD23596.1 helix-turn-helix transcriptional regulator [Kribbella turkmenica]